MRNKKRELSLGRVPYNFGEENGNSPAENSGLMSGHRFNDAVNL
jgi:hypothetical protein